jgi:ABC-type uncharacterized transport system substrate-binding protein
MKKFLIFVCCFLSFASLAFFSGSLSAKEQNHKVLYVDSYHPEYEPGIMMREAVKEMLTPAGIKLHITYLNAKKDKEEELIKAAALRTKALIESWKPDLIIAADDSASRYLIKPYYKNSDIPVVFIGVNWDISEYGYPYKNVTGQIEVELISELIYQLRQYSKGSRIGILSGNTLTDRKSLDYYRNTLKIKFDKTILTNNFSEWEKGYRVMQKEVDILILRNNSGIAKWDSAQAKKIILDSTTIPTGSASSHMYDFVLISHAKVNREFGIFAANSALAILNGVSPEDIPISTNRQVKTYLNMKLAKKLGIKFPIELIEKSHLVSAQKKKLLFVNSYHKGYKWSDDIEKGLFKALKISEEKEGLLDTSDSKVDIKIVRMDTKIDKSEESKVSAGAKAKEIADRWKPDIIITSDDNAAKYFIVPYYKNSEIPVVFCGINGDASPYGFPTANITGIIEIAPMSDTISLAKKYAKGERINFIGYESISSLKIIDDYKKTLEINLSTGKMVNTFKEWKEAYIELQKNADILLILNTVGIKSWNEEEAYSFILANTNIPTIGISDTQSHLYLLGKTIIAEEQGWWAGKTALRILDGEKPSDIAITKNKESLLYINMDIARRLGIKFPIELLEQATLIKGPKQE